MDINCDECGIALVRNSQVVAHCCGAGEMLLCYDHAPWGENRIISSYVPGYVMGSTVQPPAEPHNIERPKHYWHGSISDIDVAEDWNSPPWIVHALCYLKRWPHKNGIEDLRKARDCITYQIEALESKTEEENDA